MTISSAMHGSFSGIWLPANILSRFLIDRWHLSTRASAMLRKQGSQLRQDTAASSMRYGESNEHCKIRDCKSSAACELPPFPGLRVVPQNRHKRSEDENEMPEAAQRHHHRYELLHVPSAQP